MRCASFTCLSNVHLSIGLHRDCCNLSTAVALNVRFTMNGMCTKNNTHIYVARTRNNRVIMVCNLYCCLLPQCEAFRTCCSDFSTATIQGLQLTEARNKLRSIATLRSKLRSIRLVWITVVALQILLNDKYKLASLQGDGSRTRQEIPHTADCKARACNCCFR